MRLLIILGIVITISIGASAQSGKISGKVINAGSGQVLASATLTLIEKSKIEIADQNGTFVFSKLEAGVYSIKCSYTGHNEKIIEDIVLKNDENIIINISLEERKSDGVVLNATRIKAAGESVASLLIVQKNSASVSDGITAESIRKTPDRNTSDVLKRVSGASIQDDRFAIIRGLNDRYNAAFINGAPLPSTESDRKAFAFDIFPSAILDNLVIYKTATPDKSGEFAGGIIDITTKSIPTKSFTSITIGGSYNTFITGKTRYHSEIKGKTDWIGLDDGTRGIPEGLPSTAAFRSLTFAQRAELAKSFGNYRWGIKQSNTAPNFNFQFSKGLNIQRKQKEFLGVLFSINYSKNFSLNKGERNSYDFDLTAPPDQQLVQKGKFMDSIYNDEVILSALGNISVKLDNRNTLGWKNNYSINTDNKLIKRFGPADFTNDPTIISKDVVRWYTSNRIFSSQLSGEHQVGKIKSKINWQASYSTVKREIPNLSRTTYSGTLPNINTAVFTSGPPNQTSGSGTMFFANNDESLKNIKTDIIQPYTLMKNSQNFLKIGGGYQFRERQFATRLFGFSPYTNGVTFENTLTQLPEDQIFLPPFLGRMFNGKGGFLLNDGTLANSDYTASSSLSHIYLMSDQRFFKKLRLIYGVRMESFNQKLKSIKNLNQPVSLDSTITDFLPSANIVYAVTSKMNLRLSYSQTLNRPEFRELAPFLFFEFVNQYAYQGQETLKRAKIKNYDFRFEFFPGKAQLFSVSGFYKDFSNPIEVVTIPNTTNQAAYNNAISAEVYGVEAEFRTLLSTLFGDKKENGLLSKFTLAANASYIKSNMKLGGLFGIDPSQLVTDRALQGQSPYLINGSLGFNDEEKGFSSTLSVNRVGDRITIAGTYNNADIYEKARTIVDFQLAKFFLKNKLELKLTVRDILAQNIDFYLDFDKSKSFTDSDRYFSSNQAPKIFSFSATYKF